MATKTSGSKNGKQFEDLENAEETQTARGVVNRVADHANGDEAGDKPAKVAKAAKEKPAKEVKLFSIQAALMKVRVVGTTPLITNKFSHESIKKMADAQQQNKAASRAPKDPIALYKQTMYLMPGGNAEDDHPDCGVPSAAFKGAMVSATRFTNKAIPATFVRGAFHIVSDADMLTRIEYGEVRMREDRVVLPTGTSDLRYRAEFTSWSAVLTIKYNANIINPERMINLLNIAGFSVGVCEWRPERGKGTGSSGLFEVDPSFVEQAK